MSGTLIASVSGIRGIFGDGLDPAVLVRYSAAFGDWCRTFSSSPTVVVGRDARVTGPICTDIVISTLLSCGCNVIHAGLATTPTVEMAVIKEGAAGGIILSASHNPAEWNALKLLNSKGEFLSPEEGNEILRRAADDPTRAFQKYDLIGRKTEDDYLEYHLDQILDLEFVDREKIGSRDFHVLVDGINSVGGFAIPDLLRKLGVTRVTCVNCEPTGLFAHPAEPLPQNLISTIGAVRTTNADLGIVVDPDADRLALIADGGAYVSEELTQVIAADFLWRRKSGPFVTNLSSSRAIELVADKHGQPVYRSAVGEINVVKKMQEVDAVLGGEGNGGVILPDLHYGRDALVGTAMVLQHLTELDIPLSALVDQLPKLSMAKKKAQIGDASPDDVLARLAEKYQGEKISTIDGVKIDFADGWVHVRKSNTEPIVRVYTEMPDERTADELADRFLEEIEQLR